MMDNLFFFGSRGYGEQEIFSPLKAAQTNSGLEEDTFVLLIQTAYQHEIFKSHGESFAGIDATHNTTHYQNTSLFTMLVQD